MFLYYQVSLSYVTDFSKIEDNRIYMLAGGVISSSIIITLIILIYFYFNDQLSTITTYSTIIGAVANLFLVLATWGYLGEVRKQVNIMAADGVSGKMRENNEYLLDMMTKLVAPLYFSKNDEMLFGKTSKLYRTHDYDPSSKEYFNFWTPIEINMHLASPSLFLALEKYLDVKNAYWDALYEHANMHNVFAETPEGSEMNQKFDDARSALSLEINIAYKDLKSKLRPPDPSSRF